MNDERYPPVQLANGSLVSVVRLVVPTSDVVWVDLEFIDRRVAEYTREDHAALAGAFVAELDRVFRARDNTFVTPAWRSARPPSA